MRAITVRQPFAHLITLGTKPYETRSWPPPRAMVGATIAIHAGKHRDRDGLDDAHAYWDLDPDDMAFGAIVCVVRLSGWHQMDDPEKVLPPGGPGWGEALPCARSVGVDSLERQRNGRLVIPTDVYGDYAPGRWAWRFEDVLVLKKPIEMRGYQGLWECGLQEGRLDTIRVSQRGWQEE